MSIDDVSELESGLPIEEEVIMTDSISNTNPLDRHLRKIGWGLAGFSLIPASMLAFAGNESITEKAPGVSGSLLLTALCVTLAENRFP